MPYILGAFPAENQASMKPYCFSCKSCSADARMHTSVQADPTRGNCQNCQHILLRCYWQSNNIIKDLSLSFQFCYCSSIFNQSFVLVRQLSFVLYFLIHIDLLRAEISRRSLLWILYTKFGHSRTGSRHVWVQSSSWELLIFKVPATFYSLKKYSQVNLDFFPHPSVKKTDNWLQMLFVSVCFSFFFCQRTTVISWL